MKLEDLIRRFRTLAKDKVEPYLFENEDVVDWLNDAQAQACIRRRLIREDALPAVCRIELAAGKHTYPLHASVFEIIHLQARRASDSQPRPMTIVTREWLEAEVPGWRDRDYPSDWVIQDDTTLRVVGRVENGEVLELECYRLPLKPFDVGNDTAKPEIHEAHHEHLIQWALHRAFSVPDTESFDPDRAVLAERAFTAYFGPMPDADLRRDTRADVQHFNRGVLP